MNEIQVKNDVTVKSRVSMEFAESYLMRIYDDMREVKHGFIRLAFHLNEIKKCEYYKAAGYGDFYEFCEVNYGLDKTKVKRYIEIWYRFAMRENGGSCPKMFIDEKYADYNYSQLCEMVSMKHPEKVKPNMTIKEIRELKKSEKTTANLNSNKAVEPVEVSGCDVAPLPPLQLPEEPEETELENQRNNMLNQLDRIQTAIDSASIFLTLEQQKNIFHEINVLMCMVQLLH